MAKFHDIDSDIWEELLEYSPNQKLVYIYLFSNPLCRPSGLYTIKTQTIKHHTGQGEKELKTLCGKLIDYDFETSEVFVRGKLKRILSGFKNNENMKKAVKSDFDSLSSVFVKHSFYRKYEGALEGLASPPLPLPLPLPLESNKALVSIKGENPEKQASEVPPREKWFDEVWQKYPNKDGKKHAKRHFFNSVKTQDDYARITRALENYIGSERVRGGFIKNGSTWFNDWEGWVDYSEEGKRVTSRKDDLLAKIRGQ
jgi:hypothetical protein